MANRKTLTEVAKAKPTESKGIWSLKLIAADVHGSSGYYPSSVLERDGASAFPAGTHVYLDHPTFDEEWERPERSVRDMAGALTEDAQFRDDPEEGPGLYSKVEFRPALREDAEFYAKHAGMSIRAIGITDESPVTGELVVQEIVEGLSVDVVTHAGAGGKLVAMAESARKGNNTENSTGPAEPQLFKLEETDKQGLNKLYEAVSGLTAQIAELQEKAKAAQEAANAPEQLSVVQVVAKLDESGLPAASRKRLAEAYQPGTDLDAAIASEKALVAEIAEAFKGNGGTPVGNGAANSTGSVRVEESANTASALDSSLAIFGLGGK